MANPQPDKFTKISSEMLDALCKMRIPGEARQVFDCIMRKTYGFYKQKDSISLSQFSEATGMTRQNCSRALKKLESLNLIKTEKTKFTYIYSIQKNYDAWLYSKTSVLKNEYRPVLKFVEPVLENEYKTVLTSEYNNRRIEYNTIDKIERARAKAEKLEAKAKAKAKAETTEEQIFETVKDIWLRTFSRTPKTMESELTEKLIQKFGKEKVLKTLQKAVRNNFRSIFTVEKCLDSRGNLVLDNDKGAETSKKLVFDKA